MITARPFRLARATNSAAADWTAQNAGALPSLYIDLLDPHVGKGGSIPEHLALMPYGSNADNETFDMRVYGWNLVLDEAIYVPQLLLDVTCTLCALTITDLGASHFLVDTIVVNDGSADTDDPGGQGDFLDTISPAEDLPGSIVLHTRGCRYIAWDFKLGTAAAMNCLWRPVTKH